MSRLDGFACVVVAAALGAAACGGPAFSASLADASVMDAALDSSMPVDSGLDRGAEAGPEAGAGCVIDGMPYSAGATNPANICQACRPRISTSAWSQAVDGTTCMSAMFCISGTCVSGCEIDLAFVAAKSPNTKDPCQICVPATSSTAWTNAADGTSCGNGQICANGQCGTQCEIVGMTVASGAANPGNACQSCQPGTSTSAWTTSNGMSCDLVDGGTSCIDTTMDPNNCGGCGTVCNLANVSVDGCANGSCTIVTCNMGYADCDNIPANGCEADLASDPKNCSACGHACAQGTCVMGACDPFPSTGNEGAFAPTVSVSILQGTHNFTTITVPAGVTVTASAGGLLDLRATGNITIAGVVDVSGGPGGTTSLGSVGGGGGDTGLGSSQTGAPGSGGSGGEGIDGGTPTSTTDGGTTASTAGGAFGGGAGAKQGCGGGGGGHAGGGGGGWINGACAGGIGAGGAGSSAGGNAGVAPYSGGAGVVSGTGMTGGGGGSIGPLAAADLAIVSTFQPGSGGGGGTGNGTLVGAGGGGAGGALRLASPTTITVSGSLLANGGAGGAAGMTVVCATSAGGGGGGGGSGGAIYLSSPTVSVMSGAVVSAVGGAVGLSCNGSGGAGGLGRIRLSLGTTTCNLTGTFNPQVFNVCNPANQSGRVYVGAYPY
jgi:hypothetical protein